jgi:hypothetical protein
MCILQSIHRSLCMESRSKNSHTWLKLWAPIFKNNKVSTGCFGHSRHPDHPYGYGGWNTYGFADH